MITLENLLKKLVKNRNKDDLHSAVCYFKTGVRRIPYIRIAHIYANYNKSLMVILIDEDKTVDCSTIAEVLEIFKDDELVRYET